MLCLSYGRVAACCGFFLCLLASSSIAPCSLAWPPHSHSYTLRLVSLGSVLWGCLWHFGGLSLRLLLLLAYKQRRTGRPSDGTIQSLAREGHARRTAIVQGMESRRRQEGVRVVGRKQTHKVRVAIGERDVVAHGKACLLQKLQLQLLLLGLVQLLGSQLKLLEGSQLELLLLLLEGSQLELLLLLGGSQLLEGGSQLELLLLLGGSQLELLLLLGGSQLLEGGSQLELLLLLGGSQLLEGGSQLLEGGSQLELLLLLGGSQLELLLLRLLLLPCCRL